MDIGKKAQGENCTHNLTLFRLAYQGSEQSFTNAPLIELPGRGLAFSLLFFKGIFSGGKEKKEKII